MAEPGAPTGEQGQAAEGTGVVPWSSFHVEPNEYVPELIWPQCVPVYDRMMTDAKLAGLLRSVELPLKGRAWAIDPNGADEQSLLKLSDDLDLPIVGQDQSVRRRVGSRFSFDSHLMVALKALGYGFYYFEQVGEITELFWHLKKLAPRPPRTIAEINVDADGGLKSVRQNLGGGATAQSPELSVDRLVCYVWDYEAANWTGRSLLRPCYRNWLIKDRLLRVDAIKHERSGMGIPVAEAPPGAGPEEVAELAGMVRSMKVTESGGGAVPAGTKLQLMGTSGSLPDTIASVQFHNEEMNGAFLANFQNLGAGAQSGGSYALGKVQYDFFGQALDAIQDWIIATFNPHVIEDWYDYNHGPESQPARLVVEEEPDPVEQASLFNQGIDESDEEAEDELDQFATQARAKLRRARVRRGRRHSGRSDAAGGAESPSPLQLPDRPLRRQPYPHEVEAAVDYKAIDTHLTDNVASTSEQIKKLQKVQIAELHDAIIDADGDLAALAKLQPEPKAEAVILSSMEKSAKVGIDESAAEAKRQGRQNVAKPDLEDLADGLQARAAATDQLLASSLGQSASRQALRLTSEGTPAATVATQVSEVLNTYTGKFVEDQMNGALTAALNDGRRATINRNNPTKIYSSELLDENTCENCTEVDGTEYSSMEAANDDYPTGGYYDCLGMERCRGTLVAVYSETVS